MDKVFVKKADLNRVNGGYLVTGKEETPVLHKGFVLAQQQAEYVITFAEMAKDKDFEGKKADNLDEFKAEIQNKFNSLYKVEHVAMPSAPKRELNDKLAKEALSFIAFDEKKNKNEKVNNFLQQFNIVKEFEDFGLYFEKDIVKLNKIYTMEEIIKATTEVIDLLG